MVVMSLVETLVGRPLVWTVKAVTILTAAVTSPLWVPLVFFSTMAAGVFLLPAATLAVFGYVLWKVVEWKSIFTPDAPNQVRQNAYVEGEGGGFTVTIVLQWRPSSPHELSSNSRTLDTIRGVIRAIRNELFPRPGLLHPEDTGPPKEPVDGPGTGTGAGTVEPEPERAAPAAKPPKVQVETPGHEEATREYSPVKEAVKETQPAQPRRQEEEALVKRPVLTVQEIKAVAPKGVGVDKNRVLQDVYFLEEFVGVKDPGAPLPPGDIEQQINEIAKVVVGAPMPVQWPSDEDEKYVIAATQVLPALHDFIGV